MAVRSVSVMAGKELAPCDSGLAFRGTGKYVSGHKVTENWDGLDSWDPDVFCVALCSFLCFCLHFSVLSFISSFLGGAFPDAFGNVYQNNPLQY